MRGKAWPQSARHGGQSCNRSSGLCNCRMSRAMTWVYISVVFTSAWPSSSWSTRMFTPFSSIWVAKLWRRVWQPTFLSSLACSVAPFHRLLQA